MATQTIAGTFFLLKKFYLKYPAIFNINLLSTNYVLNHYIKNFTYEVSCNSHNTSVK